MTLRSRCALLASLATLCFAADGRAVALGSTTYTNSTHFGYFGFASTSAANTKRSFGPFTGTARILRVSGTVTAVSSEAWLSSIQVQPSGTGLAVYQPWIEFSKQRTFTGTVPVSATIYAPGGIDASKPINLEFFSLDSEQFVPGVDARSTLTFTLESDFAPGTAEYSGALTTRSPTFNRPAQYGFTNGLGQPMLFPPELTGAFPYYSAQAFHVDTAGSYDMVTANEFESAAVLYANSFDPANPLTSVVRAINQTGNVLRGKQLNDLPYLDDAVGASIITADLVPGVQYFFVTTAFNAPGVEPDGGPFLGRFNNIITGAGRVSLGLVPEPATAGLLMGAGLLMLRRRK